MPRRTVDAATPTAWADDPSPKVATDTFRNLRKGDLFRVKGERGQFRFTGLVTNTRTGQAWVEAIAVAGPTTGKFRAFGLTREFSRPRQQEPRKGDV